MNRRTKRKSTSPRPAACRALVRVTGDVGHDCYLEYIAEWAFALRLRGQARVTGPCSVEVIAEGSQGLLRELVRRLRIERYPVRVHAIRASYSRATGTFTRFTVLRDSASTDCIAFAQKMKFWFAPGDIFPGTRPDPEKVVMTTHDLNTTRSIDNHRCNIT